MANPRRGTLVRTRAGGEPGRSVWRLRAGRAPARRLRAGREPRPRGGKGCAISAERAGSDPRPRFRVPCERALLRSSARRRTERVRPGPHHTITLCLFTFVAATLSTRKRFRLHNQATSSQIARRRAQHAGHAAPRSRSTPQALTHVAAVAHSHRPHPLSHRIMAPRPPADRQAGAAIAIVASLSVSPHTSKQRARVSPDKERSQRRVVWVTRARI